ncbi:MAG: transposase family protein [Candidatus Methanofishera endochildressiae]|uniref:Transposase family protein n=1 Tax=Candidatus Methanofishera endochildressiae TaxID=2738884 RepID=A0A7Z0MNE3_9GAMM|nr:transposase family protein [Candidatus Methanofishera endochildressiae]
MTANEIYSWDITYLLSPIKGQYYYLYMVMDIYSRKIVGWQVHDCESSAHAADLIADIAYREKIDKNQLVIHSDNGSPMKGATLRAKMIDLEISPSYSRPRVSNDNPYSESLFKTVKYHHTFPENPFTCLNEARSWVEQFVHWYNDEHQHSAIKFVTPNQRHNGNEWFLPMQKALDKVRYSRERFSVLSADFFILLGCLRQLQRTKYCANKSSHCLILMKVLKQYR